VPAQSRKQETEMATRLFSSLAPTPTAALSAQPELPTSPKRKAEDAVAELDAVAEDAPACEPPPALDGPEPAELLSPAEESLKTAEPPAQPRAGKDWRGVNVRRVYDLRDGAVLCVSQGSVVRFKGDALVNAANRGCLGGGGVDGAVNDAGGWKLEEARRRLPLVAPYTRCPTGEARLTIGGDLSVRFVIHAVGPDYRSFDEEAEADECLASAYRSAMLIAAEQRFETVAFSLISAAIFRGDASLESVLRIAVDVLRAQAYPGLKEVHLVAFTRPELVALLDAAEAAELDASLPEQPLAAPVAMPVEEPAVAAPVEADVVEQAEKPSSTAF